MEKVKRGRSANFSLHERDILVSPIQKHKSVLENKQSDASTWKMKEAAWEDIQKVFNARSGGTFRTTKTLKVKDEGLKRLVRKKSAVIRSELYRIGGGRNTAPPLDNVEEQIKCLISLSTDGMQSIYDSDVIIQENQDNINVPKESLQVAEISQISKFCLTNVNVDTFKDTLIETDDDEDGMTADDDN
ncbi:myb/SANT-like DNA-binding domain-containing protein 4 [Spodoptera frugiperda]|uniref:Regulatory protein zeste n=1 Tax=Spodoptera frugiperda TaxID=7108 RepID=A0A9R0DUH3_SPOFR|nr:myb/SANT-like DNA-binding domain-containing protein 4 [Spodoptera frugiperda]